VKALINNNNNNNNLIYIFNINNFICNPLLKNIDLELIDLVEQATANAT
jgi:hypothetical protein